ncbi:MAG TPA: anthranilate synthase component I [Acidiferrobacteraceae bacterium]|nr:anthranilate synthase component I [Acidiferrobacteraceae bacterium]
MSISESEFKQYAEQGYNRIPLMREVLADLDTPLSTYLKLASGPYSYLFESVHGGEKWGRYSIIGLPCRILFRVVGNRTVIEQDGQVVRDEEVEDPLEEVRDFKSQFRVPEVAGLPRFTGGLVGYFGYDTVRHIETHLGDCTKPDAIGSPDILLMVSDEVVVFDNLAGRQYVVVHADPGKDDAWNQANERLEWLVKRIAQPLPAREQTPSSRRVSESDFKSEFDQEAFEEAVDICREYIRNGDIMQVVISQRLSIPFDSDPLDLYRALRTLNPSPYMYYMDLEDFHVVGSSPEILVHLEDDVVTVRPIAGTRPRGKDEQEDQQLEKDLMTDPKELAEHLMLVDLGRNDAGRVAQVGSVQLTEKMVVERYSHVMHIVSNVTGKLREGLDEIDVLRATFPAGTVSGAPKVRAMEIIDELEPVKRGVYSGAVGYLGWNGNMDTAIAIRTAVIKDGTLYIQVGAGIVADSAPSREWDETMNKGRAIFRAVAMAVAGLNNIA